MVSLKLISKMLSGVAISACALSIAGCSMEGRMPEMSTKSAPLPLAINMANYTAEDETFARPYIDLQEWRDTPVRHYYVHGGFEGTNTRFSYYFPEAGRYEGRFFQHATPVPDSENLAQAVPAGAYNKIGFAAAAGGYFVETNGGGTIDLTKGSQALADSTITAYRANAAAARFSRVVAQQLYGTNKRPYGYLFGGSGGAYRTIGSIESTKGVWDGAVPYVNGSTMAIPNMFTVRMQALRVLRDKFPQIVDAMEPGGSGNPYAGLSEYEASVLREAENMGFPMESWAGWETMGLHGFAALYGGVLAADPTYFQDFWTKPGYLGHDKPALFKDARMQFDAAIAAPVTAAEAARLGLNTNPGSEADRGGVDTAFLANSEEGRRIVGVRLTKRPPDQYFLGGDLVVKTGALAGQRIMASRIIGDIVMLGVTNPRQVAQLAAGNEVRIDNSNFLAMESYHRHQTPPQGFPVWDQFRDANGRPIYPQRPMLLGPLFVRSTAGTQLEGKFDGKMILASSLADREAMPWQADWYLQRAAANSGKDSIRVYFTQHALHGDGLRNEDASRFVPYVGTLQQALYDVALWAETGKAPAQSTQYRIEKGQVIVPDTASQRLGVQPTVQLRVGGSERIQVRVGTPVVLEGVISAPPSGGQVIAAGWDFDGTGKFADDHAVRLGQKTVTVRATHSYSAPGTYFVGLRGISQTEHFAGTPYAQLENLARVRVVVTQ